MQSDSFSCLFRLQKAHRINSLQFTNKADFFNQTVKLFDRRKNKLYIFFLNKGIRRQYKLIGDAVCET